MKRSQSLNLNRMRKNSGSRQLVKVTVKPLALAALAALVGCSQKEEAVLVNSVEDCLATTDFTEDQCNTAYQQAVDEANRTAPKYQDAATCEQEFGPNQCQRSSSGFFMPFMAGYLMSSALDFNRNRYNPVYNYQGNGRYNGQVMTSDGKALGRIGDKRLNVSRDTLTKPMPTVRRTVSRGGFGSQAAAKSNWGSSSRRGGWGG